MNIEIKVKDLKKNMVKDCWSYHKNVLQTMDGRFKRISNVEQHCLNVNGDEFTATAWELGYIYAMVEVLRAFKKVNNK